MQNQSFQRDLGQLSPTHQVTPGAKGPAVFVMVDNEKNETTFAKKAATGLSILQIICGITSFLSQITIVIYITEGNDNYRDYILGILGEGIYCGIFFIIAGGLGFLAIRKPSTCSISAFMTLSIIASIFSGILVIFASIKLSFLDGYSWVHSSYYREPKMAMLSIMIVCGVVEMVVSIVCAAICCKVCCCSGSRESASRVVYLAQGESTPTVQRVGGVPVKMEYLPQANPVGRVLDQTFNDLPSYGDVVKAGQEETKQNSGNGRYMRF